MDQSHTAPWRTVYDEGDFQPKIPGPFTLMRREATPLLPDSPLSSAQATSGVTSPSSVEAAVVQPNKTHTASREVAKETIGETGKPSSETKAAESTQPHTDSTSYSQNDVPKKAAEQQYHHISAVHGDTIHNHDGQQSQGVSSSEPGQPHYGVPFDQTYAPLPQHYPSYPPYHHYFPPYYAYPPPHFPPYQHIPVHNYASPYNIHHAAYNDPLATAHFQPTMSAHRHSQPHIHPAAHNYFSATSHFQPPPPVHHNPHPAPTNLTSPHTMSPTEKDSHHYSHSASRTTSAPTPHRAAPRSLGAFGDSNSLISLEELSVAQEAVSVHSTGTPKHQSPTHASPSKTSPFRLQLISPNKSPNRTYYAIRELSNAPLDAATSATATSDGGVATDQCLNMMLKQLDVAVSQVELSLSKGSSVRKAGEDRDWKSLSLSSRSTSPLRPRYSSPNATAVVSSMHRSSAQEKPTDNDHGTGDGRGEQWPTSRQKLSISTSSPSPSSPLSTRRTRGSKAANTPPTNRHSPRHRTPTVDARRSASPGLGNVTLPERAHYSPLSPSRAGGYTPSLSRSTSSTYQRRKIFVDDDFDDGEAPPITIPKQLDSLSERRRQLMELSQMYGREESPVVEDVDDGNDAAADTNGDSRVHDEAASGWLSEDSLDGADSVPTKSQRASNGMISPSSRSIGNASPQQRSTVRVGENNQVQQNSLLSGLSFSMLSTRSRLNAHSAELSISRISHNGS